MSDFFHLTHAAATWFMVGLIWVIQTVHYPLWVHVNNPEDSILFHSRHSRSIATLVAIVGGMEFATAAWLAFVEPHWLTVSGVAALTAVWGVTGLVQIPLHRRLSLNWDAATIRRLVASNWIRTALWTIRGAIATAILI